MLLPDIETSTERVNLRVAQKGHFIDAESIRYNFEQGLIILKDHFKKFHNLTLLTSELKDGAYVLKQLIVIKRNKISFIDPNAPLWSKPIIDELLQKLAAN